MLRPRKTISAGATGAKFDELQAALHREVNEAEADPFDDAMVAAVAGLVETMKAEADALTEMEKQLGKTGRRASGASSAGSRA